MSDGEGSLAHPASQDRVLVACGDRSPQAVSAHSGDARLRGCIDCGASITKQAKRCQPCNLIHLNSDPEIVARRQERLRERFADPEFRRRHRQAAIRTLNEWRKSPEAAKRYEQQADILREVTSRPEVRAKWLANRKEAGRKRTETVLGWCPERLRDEYRRLQRYPTLGSAGARKRIEAMMTPFERAMMRVKAGARVVEKPVIRKSYDYTLGGVSDMAA